MNGVEKMFRVGRDELAWDPRKVAVRVLSSALPQHGFNRLRTHLLVSAGVRIGRGAVVGAGAIVTGDVASNSLFAGVPARFVRTLDAHEVAADGPLSGMRMRAAVSEVPAAIFR